MAAIARNGGACFVRAPVSEITIDEASGRAVGVVARGVAMRARVAVISDAGFRNTFGSADADRAERMGTPRAAAAAVPRAPLVPPEVGAKQRMMLQTMEEEQEEEEEQTAVKKVEAILKETAAEAAEEPATAKAAGKATEPPSRDIVDGSIAMIYLFVGLDASDEALDIPARNTWVLRDYDPDGAFAHFEALELPYAACLGARSHHQQTGAQSASVLIPMRTHASRGPPPWTWNCNCNRDDGSILPRPDELPAVFVGAASAKDADWPRRHPGKAALTVLAPVRAAAPAGSTRPLRVVCPLPHAVPLRWVVCPLPPCQVRADWFDRWAGGKIKSRGAEYAAPALLVPPLPLSPA